MSPDTGIDFDLHIDEGWAWCEFASDDDLARFAPSTDGWFAALHKVVAPATRETPAMMTKDDFREIVEVFRILKRVRDEGR